MLRLIEEEENNFKFCYDEDLSIEKIKAMATKYKEQMMILLERRKRNENLEN